MKEMDGSTEVEASFEQNYQVNPNDRFVMARMTMALRQRVYPQAGMNVEDTYNHLLDKCQTMVRQRIALEQSYFIDEGKLD